MFLGLKRRGVLKVSGAVSGLLLSLAVFGLWVGKPLGDGLSRDRQGDLQREAGGRCGDRPVPRRWLCPGKRSPACQDGRRRRLRCMDVRTRRRSSGGRYKATFVHHEVVVSNGAMGVKPNSLPRKYASPTTTDLFVEIAQGETDIPRRSSCV